MCFFSHLALGSCMTVCVTTASATTMRRLSDSEGLGLTYCDLTMVHGGKGWN